MPNGKGREAMPNPSIFFGCSILEATDKQAENCAEENAMYKHLLLYSRHIALRHHAPAVLHRDKNFPI